MKLALAQKQKFPYLISGYDLVGQEDLGQPLLELAPELVWFRRQTEILNVTIPFFFHAGETLGDGNSTDLNLFDALLFQTRRIGHGFSLYKHPKLTNEVIQKTVLVEVCPISNEVLRLATDILHHPLPAMVAHGVPTAISNDDPSMLGQDIAGLSYDFYQTIQGFDNTGLAGLVSDPFLICCSYLLLAWTRLMEIIYNRALWHRTVSAGLISKISHILIGFVIFTLQSAGKVSRLVICEAGMRSGRSFANGSWIPMEQSTRRRKSIATSDVNIHKRYLLTKYFFVAPFGGFLAVVPSGVEVEMKCGSRC